MGTLIYDGECGFCRRSVEWVRAQAPGNEYLAYQERGGRFPEIPESALASAVHFVDAEGGVSSGALAIYEACRGIPGYGALAAIYRRFRPFAWISEKVYGWVAGHRPLVSRLSRWACGESLAPSSYYLVRWLFLKALALIYFAAFLSLLTQVTALIGPQGLLPAEEFLAAVNRYFGPTRFYELPTLAWISAGDGFLVALCAAGGLGAVSLLAGIAPRWAALICWLCYFSLCQVGGVFLQYQWESLLLESGFLAVFLAPRGLRPWPATESAPSRIVVVLYRWLLFRLMFASGIVKLMSGDDTWSDLTAVGYHYQSQPLPTWIAWYAHQLPQFLHQLSTLVMFAIELGVAWFVLLPRKPRRWAFWPLVALQVIILLTGNYAYFNYLTIALCLFLVDDAWLTGNIQVLRRLVFPGDITARGRSWRVVTLQLIFVWFAIVGMFRLLGQLGVAPPDGMISGQPFRWANRLHLVSGYGLFAVMTTYRDELIIEGSPDGKEWREYVMRHKPHRLNEAPGFVAPHQPRVAWQAWFAALGRYEDQTWLQNLLFLSLQGDGRALRFFAKNPFPDGPPVYVRVIRYRYEFTTAAEKRETGNWWKRKYLDDYGPTLRREGEG